MNVSRRVFLATVPAIAGAQTRATSSAGSEYLLWYRKPAASWTEALPIGNGRLGAMVFGGVAAEHLQLNEDSVWAGEKRDRNNPEGKLAIPRVRRLLREGKIREAEELADKSIIAVPRRMPPYQPLGDLHLTFGSTAEATDYRRELDLDAAIVRISYRQAGALFTREIFSSAVHGVVVVRLTCDRPRSISFSAALTREADSQTTAQPGNRLVLTGQAIARDERHVGERPTGVKFCCVVEARATGGEVKASADKLSVEAADYVTLVLAAATDYRENDPLARCVRDIAAVPSAFTEIRKAHLVDYRQFFRRVTLSLGDGPSDLPTDERLRRVQAGNPDLALEALYFHYGRYLLIASSRPGSLPANLQGIWNDKLEPPWDSKYTININTEMNYWPAEVCNLAELHLPLFDLIEKAREDGRRVARELWGANGFVLHHNTDGWGDAVPIDGVGSGVWPMGAAWLSLHYWDHYDYTRDREFLAARAYPVMKEAAEFLLSTLVDDGKGHLVTGPSISPENRYRTADGQIGRLCMGPTMDIEITDALLRRVQQAAEILSVDKDLSERIAAVRAKLPPLQTGKHGQLQEWMEDYDEPDPGHRHISHLFALHPDNRITLRGTPELAKAARTSLERRLSSGSGHTGWSRAWIINFWARLEEGDIAHDNIVALLAKSTHPNLLDNHPPFQIDGNFGGTAAVTEMLLGSHAGEIHFLPALPKAWMRGSVSGLRGRGAVEVTLAWSAGAATIASVKADVAGPRRIRPPKNQGIASVTTDGKKVEFTPGADGTVSVEMAPDVTYSIRFSSSRSTA